MSSTNDQPDSSVGTASYLPANETSIQELCRNIRKQLRHNHLRYPDRKGLSLAECLLSGDSHVTAILGEGFGKVIVLDVHAGIAARGAFDFLRFDAYAARVVANQLGILSGATPFHSQDIAEFLKDEEDPILFCFLSSEFLSREAKDRVRDYTQGIHRCIFCDTTGLQRGIDASRASDDDDSVLSLSAEQFDFPPDEYSVTLPDEEDSDLEFLVGLSDDTDVSLDGVLRCLDSDLDLAVIDFESSGLELSGDSSDIELVGGWEAEQDAYWQQDHLGFQASVHTRHVEFDRALELLRDQERICIDHNMEECLAYCLGNQAEIHFHRKSWNQAGVLFRRQEQLLEKLGRLANRSSCIGWQAETLVQQQQIREALVLFKRQELLSSQVGLETQLVSSLDRQGALYTMLGELAEARSTYTRLERLSRMTGDHMTLLESLRHLGDLRKKSNDLPGAYSVFEERARIAKQLNLTEIYAASLAKMGAVKELESDFEEAAELYQTAAKVCLERDHHELLARNLANQAYMRAFKMGQTELALKQMTTALDLTQKFEFAELHNQILQLEQRIRVHLNRL